MPAATLCSERIHVLCPRDEQFCEDERFRWQENVSIHRKMSLNNNSKNKLLLQKEHKKYIANILFPGKRILIFGDMSLWPNKTKIEVSKLAIVAFGENGGQRGNRRTLSQLRSTGVAASWFILLDAGRLHFTNSSSVDSDHSPMQKLCLSNVAYNPDSIAQTLVRRKLD